ncbi:hypothetical protein A3D88_02795 [Candidatus Peribacteria bacterium RIFCSPHIGHO2_02_FULL_52_16]|nr:MAG: hypothetical protein A2706_00620 [Candidatus Peribacteria bacterium RIFCSPHIGHO2_01_FULL_51_35]OGJ61687.1 MAG: hypothetical protein A3D88_02795 [Candidatus Peribacteria bacterium RIFCSPHIGHO2_02_FULL_52_16]
MIRTLHNQRLIRSGRVSRAPATALAVIFAAMILLQSTNALAATSSWSPTLLVNTESFQIIDEGDSTGDVEIRFGGTLSEKLFWNLAPARFEFTDDLHVQGNITGSGTLKVDGDVTTEGDLALNQDQTAADTVLTFGSDGTNETLTFRNTLDRFQFSDDLSVIGTLSGSSIAASNNISFFSGQGNAGTLNHYITADRTWTLPDDSTTLVGTGATQELKNKTINVNNNTISTITGALIWFLDGVQVVGPEKGPTFILPYAFTANDVEIKGVVGPTGAALIIDINEEGTTIFSTRPQISDGAETEAGTHAFSDTSLAKGSEIHLDVDQIGSSRAGSGITIMLMGTFDM